MSSKKQDSADENALSNQDVVDYLQKNPDFFVQNTALLEVLELPARYSGEQIVDLQHEALKRLRARQDMLVDNSRSNMSVQIATHEAVLAMMEARTLDEFIGIVQDEVPILLDIDMAAVALEGAVETIDMSAEGMPVLLPTGEVQKRLGDDDVSLIGCVETGDHLFGAARDLVRSVAIARLYPSETMPAGLLILGARDENTFNPHQGTDLITFMARVAEILVEKWLAASEMDD
ncbi:putative Site-specific tyrosine recombinase XerC [Candidatus Terasakiella magnetica]|uniref:Putative Site-specific tyrosine recombinase XerC n=1 Tax=Candidatus Terasakiella magnetica TaxID=1867952 RepID=A0A1C3RKI1_9PROT|nr:DUF484 family protein [Candidatus Terasakiella magnetica]SCA57753.1 putative Site-specific tyrosine recombinase XerC [Candidatus Terasakiella magnetica]